MRHNPSYFSADPELVRQLIRDNPWGLLVSNTATGLVASHYPILLDEDSEELAIFTHVGRPDEELHDFGSREIMLIVQGNHGYVSPSWYAPGASKVPTWNFTAAHCYGVPEILDQETNLSTLERLVAHFEEHVDEPMLLDRQWGAPVAKGTVGIRLPISRFQLKIKLSQDKDPESQRRVIAYLRAPGPYQNPALADDMEFALGSGQ